MSPCRIEGGDGGQGFPRVSGDEPCRDRLMMFSSWFSPRERG